MIAASLSLFFVDSKAIGYCLADSRSKVEWRCVSES
jgi:hypothetical protein